MTKEQSAIYDLSSIALWAARRASTKYYSHHTLISVINTLEPIKYAHKDITEMYDYAKSLLTEEAYSC